MEREPCAQAFPSFMRRSGHEARRGSHKLLSTNVEFETKPKSMHGNMCCIEQQVVAISLISIAFKFPCTTEAVEYYSHECFAPFRN